MNKIVPIHAGEILLKKFMQPLELGQTDTALRLAKFFGNSAEFWMHLQNEFDLETARDNLAEKIDEEVTLYQAY